jgi:hypothetical protein
MRIISAALRVELVNDRMSYIVLTGHQVYINVLNMHFPRKDKSGNSENSSGEELQGYSISSLSTT